MAHPFACTDTGEASLSQDFLGVPAQVAADTRAAAQRGSKSPARSGVRAIQLNDEHMSARFQDAAGLSQCLDLLRIWKLRQEKARKDDIETVIGKGQIFSSREKKFRSRIDSRSLFACETDHVGSNINSHDLPTLARGSRSPMACHARRTAKVENMIATVNVGQLNNSAPAFGIEAAAQT